MYVCIYIYICCVSDSSKARSNIYEASHAKTSNPIAANMQRMPIDTQHFVKRGASSRRHNDLASKELIYWISLALILQGARTSNKLMHQSDAHWHQIVCSSKKHMHQSNCPQQFEAFKQACSHG